MSGLGQTLRIVGSFGFLPTSHSLSPKPDKAKPQPVCAKPQPCLYNSVPLRITAATEK